MGHSGSDPGSSQMARSLRPQTVQLLRNMIATTAVTDCPVDLTRAEAGFILERCAPPLDTGRRRKPGRRGLFRPPPREGEPGQARDWAEPVDSGVS